MLGSLILLFKLRRWPCIVLHILAILVFKAADLLPLLIELIVVIHEESIVECKVCYFKLILQGSVSLSQLSLLLLDAHYLSVRLSVELFRGILLNC